MDEFVEKSRDLGIGLTEEKIGSFQLLLNELKDWNSRINLTSLKDDKEIILKHFIDSLTVVSAIPDKAKNLVDVGSGAGFPGLPVSIVRPDLKITLVESIQKKAAFLEHVKDMLSNKNISVISGRAEEAAHVESLREQFDVAVARAVAELRVLAEYCLPFVKIGGIFIAQKNAGDTEIGEAQKSIGLLGGKISLKIPITVHGLDNRQVIVVEKVSKTPIDYPRRSGIPSKKPL